MYNLGRTRMRGMILFEHYVVSMFLVKREQEDNKVGINCILELIWDRSCNI